MDVKAFDIAGAMLAVDEARAQMEALTEENDALRGRLRECRRAAREARREAAEARARAARDGAYWRHLMIAVCALVGALVCLLHTVAICWALR